ncbi:hypothetical protein PLICRDRAFT_41708 [Plicaturopsis crispa FD-325 SS-3]|nr:hypothetical protein PLICRDRAFT_41708 [Plicaturopsis crispa FD-325 SS-3]
MDSASTSRSQWLFPVSALYETPSAATSGIPLRKELYDRARGVEFLYRLGSSLALPSSAMFTAATWFHRFFMRYSMEDYHRQDVAAACIFLATKTEECGRKLRDVARVCHAKITGEDVQQIRAENKEVEQLQAAILNTEEVLLEALCFDFVIESPHACLIELFEAHGDDPLVQDFSWSIAHDSYRTPLCVLYPPPVIATACYVLAQRIVDGPHSPSLDARISSPAPTTSLPTPPSHKPTSPDASRYAIEYFGFNEVELEGVSETLAILLEFYNAQDVQGAASHLSSIIDVPPPTTSPPREKLYTPFSHVPPSQVESRNEPAPSAIVNTPSSSHGGSTPVKTPAWAPVKGEVKASERKLIDRLDLS